MADIFQNDMRVNANIPVTTKNIQHMTVNQIIAAAQTRIADFRVGLRVRDEQQFIERYKWKGLPEELDAELIERILYYRGQAALFRFNDKFFFLPFSLSSDGGTSIDPYGRFNQILPLVFNGSQSGDKQAEMPFVKGMTYEVVKNVAKEYIKSKDPNKCAVICWDYSPQVSQTNIPRYKLQETLINAMSEQIVLSRSAIIANMPADTLLVTDQGQADSVRAEIAATESAILAGMRIIPITSPLNTNALQNHSGGSNIVQDTWMNFASMDSIRLTQLGIVDKGPSDKKAQKLEAEQDDETDNTKFIYDNGLKCRQRFANIVNALWSDLNISVSKSDVEEEDEDLDTDTKNNVKGSEQND